MRVIVIGVLLAVLLGHPVLAPGVVAQEDGVVNGTAGNSTDGGGSEWSVGRVLALIDDPPGRHPNVDVDSLERWYDANKGEFSSTERRYVEAWLTWAQTGQRPTEGLHPDLQPEVDQQTRNGSAPVYGVIPDSNVSGGDLERGQRPVSDEVTVMSWEFRDENDTWVGVVRVSDRSEELSYMDFGRMASTGQFTSESITVPRGTHVVRLPAGDFEGTRLVTLAEGDEGNVFREIEPPFLRSLKGYYLWVVLLAGAVGSSLYALRFYLSRERVLQRYHTAAALISGNVGRANLRNRFFGGDDPDEAESTEEPDGVRGLIRRWLTLRKMVWTVVRVGALLYLADVVGILYLPLPPISDEIKLVVGGIAVVYVFIAPSLLRPILEAWYSPELESVVELDAYGRVIRTYWAKKGVFVEDYEYDSHPPTRETPEGDTAYLVREFDRSNRVAEAAFEWQADQVEEIEGIENEKVEFLGDRIAVDQIISDAESAAVVIKDMLQKAEDGRQLKKAFAFVRARDTMREARDIAVGINRAVSGSSVEDILADMIDTYEKREEEIEDQFRRQTELERSLDEYEDDLTGGPESGPGTGSQPGDMDE
jgi:hypothetical protein